MREQVGYQEFKSVAIVAHEPDLSELLEWLLGTTTGRVDMKKGSLAGIQIAPPARCGSLVFLIPPSLIKDGEEQ